MNIDIDYTPVSGDLLLSFRLTKDQSTITNGGQVTIRVIKAMMVSVGQAILKVSI
jgi:hypothetical protein